MTTPVLSTAGQQSERGNRMAFVMESKYGTSLQSLPVPQDSRSVLTPAAYPPCINARKYEGLRRCFAIQGHDKGAGELCDGSTVVWGIASRFPGMLAWASYCLILASLQGLSQLAPSSHLPSKVIDCIQCVLRCWASSSTVGDGGREKTEGPPAAGRTESRRGVHACPVQLTL